MALADLDRPTRVHTEIESKTAKNSRRICAGSTTQMPVKAGVEQILSAQKSCIAGEYKCTSAHTNEIRAGAVRKPGLSCD